MTAEFVAFFLAIKKQQAWLTLVTWRNQTAWTGVWRHACHHGNTRHTSRSHDTENISTACRSMIQRHRRHTSLSAERLQQTFRYMVTAAVNHWQQLSITDSSCQSPTSAVNHRQLLSITDTSCQSLTAAVNHWQQLSITDTSCQSLTAAVNHRHQLSITDSSCQSPTVAVNYWHQSSIDRTEICESQSLPAFKRHLNTHFFPVSLSHPPHHRYHTITYHPGGGGLDLSRTMLRPIKMAKCASLAGMGMKIWECIQV